ncbi:hypothetical protein DFH29DRAFT_1003814 [Suillus ampliporus]|nr:hypothetical protein DFH29DRAFT_1003814 [Suillus ampliporus]
MPYDRYLPDPNINDGMFVNGTFDYNGPVRLQPSSATTRKKNPDGADKPDAEEPPNLSDDELPSKDDMDRNDFSRSLKQKLNAGGEEKRVIGNKPSAKAAGKVHAKGGHSSPLTVGSSGDEQQQPPAIDNAAMCICDGPPDVTKVQRARPVAKGSQPLLTKAMHLLQEDEDLQNNRRAMRPEASVDRPPSAQVAEVFILPVAPSSPHNSDHPAELTEDNGQSVPPQARVTKYL